MSGVRLFMCPRCNSGRQLPPYVCDKKVRCLRCNKSFRLAGHVFDASDWLKIGDPILAASVAAGMQHELSARKWRLLACAIGRTAFEWCHNPWFRDALQSAEQWADEGTAPPGVKLCRTELGRVQPPSRLRQLQAFEGRAYDWPGGYEDFVYQLRQEREQFAWLRLAQRCIDGDPHLRPDDITANTRPLAADLLRDLVPNPFLPLAWKPEWFTSTVRNLAHVLYDSREFSAMPILADALQDAGCDNEQILRHCRGNGPHARGCWVLDAILGKT